MMIKKKLLLVIDLKQNIKVNRNMENIIKREFLLRGAVYVY